MICKVRESKGDKERVKNGEGEAIIELVRRECWFSGTSKTFITYFQRQFQSKISSHALSRFVPKIELY